MFKKQISLTLVLIVLAAIKVSAQLTDVLVEKYYISDANDATDTLGGFLAPGSITYRVYIQMMPGSKIRKIYGDVNHRLYFKSTEIFFNNKSEGQTFGKDFNKSRLSENTTALDSWLTLNQVTRVNNKIVGVLKPMDDDGSFVGGVNNDGGSLPVATGLLANNDPMAGIPITLHDGNDTLTVAAGTWYDYGIVTSGVDSTIFGSVVSDSVFESYNCGLQYSAGMLGVNPDTNLVLVAQLTTHGELQFELNLEIQDGAGLLIKYVARDSVLLPDETWSRKLSFPFEAVCGCPDPAYLEYLADRDCDAVDSCQHVIVFGCMDTLACNYDAAANVNVQSLCCYPGRCNDRDLALVCPQLMTNRDDTSAGLELFPNPASEFINVNHPSVSGQLRIRLFDVYGRELKAVQVLRTSGSIALQVDDLPAGYYVVVAENENGTRKGQFVKTLHK